MSANPQIVGVHFGRNGMEYTTRDDAVTQLKTELTKHAFDPFVTRDEQEVARRIQAQTEARQRFSEARFHAYRDASEKSLDIEQDPQVDRRYRRFSLTRDMIEGPQSQIMALDLATGKRGLGSVGHDRQRFLREADMLRMMKVIDERDMPDWRSDESVHAFFVKVHDKAMQEARDNRKFSGQRNKVIDSAPGIYLFTELLKRSEKLIEEDFTELWARAIFPVMDLNTWLPQWMYERMDERSVFPTMVDVESLPSGAPRSSNNRAGVSRPLVFWHHAASWSDIELMRYAEAVANGAPNIHLDQKRIDTSIRMMNWQEDIFAFFGDDDMDIHGVFSAEAKTGIQRVASGGLFGAGSTEADRSLLTRETKLILRETEKRLAPNTIMLSTASWLYVTDKRYGDATNPSDQTVIEAAEATLRKLGIQDVLWVPEVGWAQAQEDRLKAHGVDASAAARLAGGLSSQQTMITMRRDPEVAELVVAKNRVMYPARETVNGRVEARMLQGGGGMVFYRPEAIKITTNVGPTL